MDTRIDALKSYIFDKKHHAFRQAPVDPLLLANEFAAAGTPPMERAVRRFCWMLAQEQPHILPNQTIALLRTVPVIPEIFTPAEWTAIKRAHAVCELGRGFNVNPDYGLLLQEGFGGRKRAAEKRLADAPCTDEQRAFLQAEIDCVNAILAFCERYAALAEAEGHAEMARILRQAPDVGAKTFQEALQLLRLGQFCLWCGGHYHNTWGRFDQYMLPYYEADVARGIAKETIQAQMEEFFVLLNCDSDLYVGMQQGDNGQSMVLGGVDRQGCCAYNALSEMALHASLHLKLIDPKINLRVDKNTPESVFELGTQLTREGLGFPQYNNDDIVIPALVKWGYAVEDARDYVVAACWEFIIPGKGMDVVNIGALCLADAVRAMTVDALSQCADFDAFLRCVRAEIRRRCEAFPNAFANLYMEPAPMLSLFMDGCVEQASDCVNGLTYNNYGIHGTGLATAADSLAAIRKLVFTEKSVTAAALTEALETDFAGSAPLRAQLVAAPKVGNDDPAADEMLSFLTDAFADGLAGLHNDRGGIFRAGTGSAMFYITHGEALGATADGRHAGAWLSANYSPSLDIRLRGPLSVVHSFTVPDLSRVCNGGPLTLELHDTVFSDQNGLSYVARLVRLFILRGGHQLQLNTINRDRLYEAKAHPELHRNLIVRVWGWSGYFVELEEMYQDHIIRRVEFTA